VQRITLLLAVLTSGRVIHADDDDDDDRPPPSSRDHLLDGGSTRGSTTLVYANRGVLVATHDPLPAYEPAFGAAASIACPD
jgi:hypothetical protein